MAFSFGIIVSLCILFDTYPTEARRKLTAEKCEMKCEIKGERQLQNPTHCITFTTNEQGKKEEGFDESGECCWAGTHESWVPKHLRNIVEVKEDGKILINYGEFVRSNLDGILVPLISSYADRIEFSLKHPIKEQSCIIEGTKHEKEECIKCPYMTDKLIDDPIRVLYNSISFSYSNDIKAGLRAEKFDHYGIIERLCGRCEQRVYLPYEISLPYEYVAPLFSTRKTVKVENRAEKLRNLLRFEIAKDKLTGKFNLRSDYYNDKGLYDHTHNKDICPVNLRNWNDTNDFYLPFVLLKPVVNSLKNSTRSLHDSDSAERFLPFGKPIYGPIQKQYKPCDHVIEFDSSYRLLVKTPGKNIFQGFWGYDDYRKRK